jgi:transposase
MRSPANWRHHSPSRFLYDDDLINAVWMLIGPLMPEPAPCTLSSIWMVREVLNAISSVLRGVIAWRLTPKDLPPRSIT